MKKIVQLKHGEQEVYPSAYSQGIIHKGELLYDILNDSSSSISNLLLDVDVLQLEVSGKQDTLIPGNALEIDGSLISVTSHEYNSRLNQSDFLQIPHEESSSRNSVLFGEDNIIYSETGEQISNNLVHGFSNIIHSSNSHAEGKDTEALENQAHSEGEFTVAQGINSHSEGQYTTAFGTASHAEGEGGNVTLFKVATDDEDPYKLHYLTSFGSGSLSDSSFNFLAGSDFTSDALFGDSDSDITEKYGIEKANKYAGWVGRTLYNADGSILGTIVRFPDKTQGESGNWFIVDLKTNINDYVSAYIKTGASGEDSHSEGYLSDAAGKYSHAEGERTRVTGTAAHGEGTRTQAYGAYSHAEGEQTQALAFGAHSEGKYTHAEGEYTHVEGYDTKASGLYAHAEGIHSSAQGEGSHAEGYNCSTDGNTVFKPTEYIVNVYDYDEDSDELTLSISEGSGIYNFGRLFNTFKTILFRNSANAKFYLINYKVSRFDADNDLIILGKDLSVRSGASCIKYPEYIYVDNDYRVYKEVTSVAAHAEGKDTAASETASHSEGINTRADGDAAHAEGIDSKALSKYAHAEGINTYVSEHSEGSHTEGFETQVKSNYSHAEGYKTDIKESAIGSHAEGFETLVEGQYSHAEGVKTETKNYSEHALGFRNKSHYNSDNWGDKGNTLFSVGSGGRFVDAYVSEPEFIGYLKGTRDWLKYNTWLYYAGSDESAVLNNCLILEQQEGTTSDIADIPNLIGSLLFLDDTKTKYLGKVIAAARCSSSEDEDKSKCRIYLSLDTGFSAQMDPGIALSTWKVEKTEDTEPIYINGEDQSNALEITQNGSIYVRGVGDYRGDNIDSAVSLQTLIKRADPLNLEPLFEVIAAALNDLNTRVNSIDAVASATLVNHEDRIQTLEE